MGPDKPEVPLTPRAVSFTQNMNNQVTTSLYWRFFQLPSNLGSNVPEPLNPKPKTLLLAVAVSTLSSIRMLRRAHGLRARRCVQQA